MFPIAVAGVLLPSLVVAEFVELGTNIIENFSDIDNNVFNQNYMRKRLSLELSKNYTTSLKDVNGSVIPTKENVGNLQQIERLIQATINQSKFR